MEQMRRAGSADCGASTLSSSSSCSRHFSFSESDVRVAPPSRRRWRPIDGSRRPPARAPPPVLPACTTGPRC